MLTLDEGRRDIGACPRELERDKTRRNAGAMARVCGRITRVSLLVIAAMTRIASAQHSYELWSSASYRANTSNNMWTHAGEAVKPPDCSNFNSCDSCNQTEGVYARNMSPDFGNTDQSYLVGTRFKIYPNNQRNATPIDFTIPRGERISSMRLNVVGRYRDINVQPASSGRLAYRLVLPSVFDQIDQLGVSQSYGENCKYMLSSSSQGLVERPFDATNPNSVSLLEAWVRRDINSNTTGLRIKAFRLLVDTVCGSINVTTQPVSQTGAPGQYIALTAGATTNAHPSSLSYQWYKGVVLLPGQTGPSLTLSNIQASDAGTYFCRFSIGCAIVDSAVATLTVCSAPGILCQPAGGRYCDGGSVPLNFCVDSPYTPITYRWFRDGFPVFVGTPYNARERGNYHCVATNSCGASITSNSVQVERCDPLFETGILAGLQLAACSNGTVDVPLTFMVIGGCEPITYQWYRNGVPIPAPLGQSNPYVATRGGVYLCRATNPCGSVEASRTIREFEPPAFDNPPSGPLSSCVGPRTLCANARTPTDPVDTYRIYQWYLGGNPIPGATQVCLDIDVTGDSGPYVCRLTGYCGPFAETSPITILAQYPPTGWIERVGGGSGTVCSGSSVSLVARVQTGNRYLPATGYQWKKDGINISNGGVFSGATTASLTINPVGAATGGNYTVEVTSPCETSPFQPYVLTPRASPIITQQPTDQAYCPSPLSTSVQFCLQTSGPFTRFEWFRECNGVATSLGPPSEIWNCTTFFTPTAQDYECRFYCIVTNGACPPVQSGYARIVPAIAPTIVIQPILNPRLREECDDLRLFVVAAGTGPLRYQWYHNGIAINCTTNASACTANLIVRSARRGRDDGQYRCDVSSTACASLPPVRTTTSTVDVFCGADLDNGSGLGDPDGGVGIEDLLFYLRMYGDGDPAADLTDGNGACRRDGGVGIEDLLFFLNHFDQGC